MHCNFARTSRAQHKPSWTLTALTLRRSHKGQWHRGLPWLYAARELRVAGAVCHVGGKAGRTSERVLLGKGTVSPELFASCGFRNSELKDLNACLVWDFAAVHGFNSWHLCTRHLESRLQNAWLSTFPSQTDRSRRKLNLIVSRPE